MAFGTTDGNLLGCVWTTNVQLLSEMNSFGRYDELLRPSELELVERAAAFCNGDFAHEIEVAFKEGRPFDTRIIAEWAEFGMLKLQVPIEQGGYGASFICKVRVAQEMAKVSFAAAFALNNMQGMVTRVAKQGSQTQKDYLLEGLMAGSYIGAPAMTEPEVGSDLGALSTRATKVDGGWLLNGTKAWITNGAIANCLMVLARCETGNGTEDIAGFLVTRGDTNTFTSSPASVPGGASFRLAEIRFDNHYVPDWGLMYEPGQAFKRSLQAINAARVHVAAMCLASLDSALEAAVIYAGTERKTFGRPLLDHQGVRWNLADVAIRLDATNALVLEAARDIEAGRGDPGLCAAAKVFATDTAKAGIDQCIQAMGAVGASSAYRLSMLQSELRLASYADGTTEMLRDRVGHGLLKRYSTPSAA